MDRNATCDLSIQGAPQLRTRGRGESRCTQAEHTRNEQQSQAMHPHMISYFGTRGLAIIPAGPDTFAGHAYPTVRAAVEASRSEH